MKITRLLAGTAIAGSAFISFPAFAQGTPSAGDCAADSTIDGCENVAPDTGTIVVTGTRIRKDEFSAAEPITVITADEITQAGFGSATDALQSGAVTQGSGQINNFYGGFVTDGGTGANTLGLRGLGPARTLILLNGRRLAPGGTRGSLLAADLNVLPTAIVDRIEVLKAGASSIYGSDAVAGVVNIITNQKLRGLELEGQVTVPQVGAGIERRIAASFGFESDRLSVVGSLEYRKRDKYALNDNPWFSCPVGGYLDGEGSAFGSADTAGFDGSTCFTLDNGGVTINTLGVPTRTGIDRVTGLTGRYNRFVPDATNTAGPVPGYKGVTTYSRDTFDPESQEEPLITPAEIFTGYGSAVYKTDALGNAEVYGEVLATRRKSSNELYRQLSLDYVQGSPLLPTQFRNGALLAPNTTSGGLLVAARAFIGYGLTDTKQSVDYVRAGAGIRGDFFFDGWRYDAYIGKSWNDGTYEAESFLTDRLAQSLSAVANGDGTFSCSTVAVNPNCVAAPYLTAAVIGGDLPENFRNWIVDNTIGKTKFRESTFSFNIDGPLFKLPGGEAQLALGAEYRRQRINDQPDANSVNGNLYGLTAATPTVGKDNVKEVYGEVYLPLLSDVPGAYRLNLTASARYTDYASYGSDTTWKVAGEWEPIRGFALRGSYGTSYRAPALAEQYLGATSGFLSGSLDPCEDPSSSATGLIISANCASIGIDTSTFTQTSSITTYRVGGADAGLKAETSKNWNVGIVARPLLPESFGQLSLSLDYFDIKVDNGVADLAAGTILNRCYSDANFDPTAGFCRFVTRNSSTNALTVVSSYVNLSQDIVRGFEFNGRYARDLFGGRFTFNANITNFTKQASRLFPEEYLTDTNGTLTSPNWVGNFDFNYRFDNVSFRWGIDWTDGDHHRTYEYFAYDELTGISDPDTVQSYRDNYYLEANDYFLHSASVQFDVNDKLEFTFGVRNLFNTKPPMITAIGYTTIANFPLYSGYDYRGRTFFANVTTKF